MDVGWSEVRTNKARPMINGTNRTAVAIRKRTDPRSKNASVVIPHKIGPMTEENRPAN